MPKALALSGPTVSKYLCTSDIVNSCVAVKMRAVGMNGRSPSTEFGTSFFVIDNQWYQPYPRPGALASKSFGPINLYYLWRRNPNTKSETGQ